ncbi:MAG: hypothetical protein HQL06_07720 [Nitrospirae bacterium]|nr:hypothetical protein [Nitrospirota bacterium]
MIETLPTRVSETLENMFGQDVSMDVIKSLDTYVSDLIDYKWKTSKDEILSEMEKKFATKSDQVMFETEVKIAIGKVNERITSESSKINEHMMLEIGKVNERITEESGKILSEFKRIDGEFKVSRLELKIMFLFIIFFLIITNPRALDIIAKTLVLIK